MIWSPREEPACSSNSEHASDDMDQFAMYEAEPLGQSDPKNPNGEWATFEKKQQADLRRADEVSDGVCIGLEHGMDFAWEWPSNASKGWKSKAIVKLLKKLRQLGRPVFWARFHGCAYGLEYNGLPIQKSWTVLTSCRQIWMGLSHRCPGHSEHLQCRGKVAQFSAYYPPRMVTAVVKAIIASWNEAEDKQEVSIADDVQQYLLQCPSNGNMDVPTHQLRDGEPEVMALTRNRFPKEPPSGKRLETIRQSMLRIHRASGHTSMQTWRRCFVPDRHHLGSLIWHVTSSALTELRRENNQNLHLHRR